MQRVKEPGRFYYGPIDRQCETGSQRCSVEEAWLASESRGDCMVITIHGDLDIVTSPQLDECLTAAQGSHRWIITGLADKLTLFETVDAGLLAHAQAANGSDS